MIAGIPRETFPGESRVALVPALVPNLTKLGMEVVVESGAGIGAGHPDEAYAARGAAIVGTRDDVFKKADLLLHVRGYGANLVAGRDDLARLRTGQILVGSFEPLGAAKAMDEMARTGVTVFALELLPRITRAQSMDVLSSMATIAGYKAVLLGAEQLPKLFPMLTTAAGTVVPARVFIVGVGVAGLMAIATARRLGAIVEAYDVRPAVREQVQSLGAKFVEVPISSAEAEDAGGYARAQDETFYRKQRELMTEVVAKSDVVITTAAVPGAKAPMLISRAMIAGMAPGSVVVDLAAERGGNCEVTRAGETVIEGGVRVVGPVNLPATVPTTASQMYAKNVATFLQHAIKDGALREDESDEILRDTRVCRRGELTHPKVKERLGALPSATS
jgi:NAD(P) transhydrogenase subunit alpha